MHSRISEPDAFVEAGGSEWFHDLGGAAKALRSSDTRWRILRDAVGIATIERGRSKT